LVWRTTGAFGSRMLTLSSQPKPKRETETEGVVKVVYFQPRATDNLVDAIAKDWRLGTLLLVVVVDVAIRSGLLAKARQVWRGF